MRYLRRRALIGRCVVLAWPQNGYSGVTLTHINRFSHTNSISTCICTCKLTLAVTCTSMLHLVPAQLNIKTLQKSTHPPTQVVLQSHTNPHTNTLVLKWKWGYSYTCVWVHITVSVLPLNMLTVMTDSLTHFIHICSHVLGTHFITPSPQLLKIYMWVYVCWLILSFLCFCIIASVKRQIDLFLFTVFLLTSIV